MKVPNYRSKTYWSPFKRGFINKLLGEVWPKKLRGFAIGGIPLEVVEKYISGRKGYEKTDTVPVVVVDEEKEQTHKTGYITLYSKYFTVAGLVHLYGATL